MCSIRYMFLGSRFLYIDLGIKLDNNKYNQKLPYIYVMTKCMAKTLSQKVVVCHPLFHNINVEASGYTYCYMYVYKMKTCI